MREAKGRQVTVDRSNTNLDLKWKPRHSTSSIHLLVHRHFSSSVHPPIIQTSGHLLSTSSVPGPALCARGPGTSHQVLPSRSSHREGTKLCKWTLANVRQGQGAGKRGHRSRGSWRKATQPGLKDQEGGPDMRPRDVWAGAGQAETVTALDASPRGLGVSVGMGVPETTYEWGPQRASKLSWPQWEPACP